MFAIEHLVIGDFHARVSSHPAHAGNDRRLNAALDFIVRLIFSNGLDQMVPFQLIWARLDRWKLP